MLQVYCALFLSFLGALVGAHIHTTYGSGGLNTAMRVCLAISWLKVLDRRWIRARVFCMMSAAVSFGATIGPLLSHFIETDPRSIKDFFMASMLFFLSHMLSIRQGQRDAIHEITMLTAPLVTTLWTATPKFIPELYMHVAYLLFVLAVLFAAVGRWRVPVLGISIRLHLEFISIVCFCFEHSVVQLMVIYLLILFFLVHLKMHTIHSITVAAQVGGNDFIITASISFFTEFVGRSVYLAIDLGTKVAGLVYEYLEDLLAFE